MWTRERERERREHVNKEVMVHERRNWIGNGLRVLFNTCRTLVLVERKSIISYQVRVHIFVKVVVTKKIPSHLCGLKEDEVQGVQSLPQS